MNANSDRLIALDEVVSRAVPVRWDEAVAVVEQLCAGLVSSKELSVPALQDILIGAEGLVTFRRPERGERGPAEAARTLHTLLSTADVPVALRLFVAQATAPEAHESVREFAAALAYFGKPTREELVRAIYDRCLAAPGSVAALETPPLPRAHDTRAPGAAEAKPSKRQLPRWAVPVGATICLLGVAAWLWTSGIAGGIQERLSSLLAGIGTTALQDASAEPSESELAAAVAEPSPTRATAAARRPSAPIQVASEPPALPLPAVSPDPPAPTAPTPVVPVALDAPLAVVEVPVEPVAVRAVYSADDHDVSPPVLRYPAWQAPLLVGSGTTSFNRIEVVVSARGDVERVRLVDGPTRMPDMMLMSAVKSWKFAPAMKDDGPVRYRTAVTWTGFP